MRRIDAQRIRLESLDESTVAKRIGKAIACVELRSLVYLIGLLSLALLTT